MIDIVEPFTLGQLSIVSYLKNLMELALKNDSHYASISEGSSYFIDRLLQGFSVEKDAVRYHLTKNHWHGEDDFCLLFFTGLDNAEIDASLNDMYAFRIKAMLNDAVVFPYENGILAISHKDHRLRADRDFIGELSRLLEKLGLCCGVSLVFQDFMNLKYACIQCKTALVSPQNRSGQRVCYFETQCTDHVIKALDASTSLKSLCHPQILRLYNAEGGKGQEYRIMDKNIGEPSFYMVWAAIGKHSKLFRAE